LRLFTPRLVLRDASPEDASALAAYQRDARYLEHYEEAPDAKAIVRAAISWQGEMPRVNYQFIVEREHTAIGCAGLRQAGWQPGHAEVGIELDPRYWGAGYAGELLQRLVRFGRDDLKLESLHARTAPGNQRARRLMERVEFRLVANDAHTADFERALRDGADLRGPVPAG
jgi:ribosomal-protein-alanine N-acetyltransferase